MSSSSTRLRLPPRRRSRTRQPSSRLRRWRSTAKLTTDDIQALVIDDKWGGTIRARIGAEVTALGQALVARLRVLADRYESTVGELDAEVEELGAKVAEHLAAMGVRDDACRPRTGRRTGLENCSNSRTASTRTSRPMAGYSVRQGPRGHHQRVTDRDAIPVASRCPSRRCSYGVNHGDVLFDRTSETQDEVAISSPYLGENAVVFGGFVFRAQPKTSHR